MANKTTKKTEKVIEPVVEIKEKIEIENTEELSPVEKENVELKKQMAEMQEKMNKLFEAMALNNNSANNNKTNTKKTVKFINMTNGKLVLRGSQIWTFEKQFDTRSFMDTEARIIIHNMPKCVRSGNVYIADAEFVEENELSLIYASLLSDKELKKLFEKTPKDIIEAYKMVSDEQKNIIVSMIIEKRNNGEEVDGNVLLTIGRLSGKKLAEIEPLED